MSKVQPAHVCLYSQPLPTTELMSCSERVDAGAENLPTVEARLLGSVTPPLNLSGTAACF